MANLLAELKRRHIYRVAAAYAVVAWVLLQLFNNVAPILELPTWIGRAVLLLLVMGFPVAILFAWMRELAPADGSASRTVTGKLDWALMGVVVVLIALATYQQLAPGRGTGTAIRQDAGVEAARAGAASPAGAISIAVLPFANMSGDTAQEFFSDGMTEEITSALAKVPGLVVLARTSAFEYKGQNRNIRAIGEALNARYLIEGSVRKAADRVRITAQLIRTDSGAHLWTESYDRQLTDIFATQEDIAKAIAGALRVPLGLKAGDSLVSDRTSDLDSYQQYLRARALWRVSGITSPDLVTLLEQVVAHDPNFAPAWALLALAYIQMPNNHPASFSGVASELRSVVDAYLPKAEAAAQRAIQLDAYLADGYLALGRVQVSRGKWLLAEELYSKALALDANNTDALDLYSNVLAGVGRPKESLAMKQRLKELEALLPQGNNMAAVLWLNGRTDAAIAIINSLPSNSFARAYSRGFLARIYASAGRYGEAADTLIEIPSGVYPPGIVEAAARLLRTAPSAVASPQILPPFGELNYVYFHVGALNRALEYFESKADAGYSSAITTSFLWHPSYGPLRKMEQFKAFVRKAGLVDYWRARGWPELCRPMGADDFICD